MFAEVNLIESLTIHSSLQSIRILVATGELKKKKCIIVVPIGISELHVWVFWFGFIDHLVGWVHQNLHGSLANVLVHLVQNTVGHYWQKPCLIPVLNTWLIKPWESGVPLIGFGWEGACVDLSFLVLRTVGLIVLFLSDRLAQRKSCQTTLPT